MEPAVVAPVESEEDVRLWAAPRMIVVTQFLAGVVFLVMALVNLLGDHQSGWDRFVGVIGAVVAGMAFGVAGSLRLQGRMVRRHLSTCHPTSPPVEAPGL